jgi:hypothetical protein
VGLAEVVIAFAVLLLVLVPVSYLLDNVLGQAAAAKNKVQALSIAEKWVEKLNATGPPTVGTNLPKVGAPIDVGTPSLTTHGRHYTTSATIKYFPVAQFTWAARTLTGKTQPDLCTTGSVPGVMSLRVTVTYPGGKVTDATVVDYPLPGLPVDGFLGVQIDGSPQSATTPTPPSTKRGVPWSQRVTKVTVTVKSITGKVYPTEHPASDGCAFFEVPVGSYSVLVNSTAPTIPTPFVAPGSTTATSVAPTTTFKVQLSKVTEAGPYLYDEGAFVNVAYPDSTVTDNAVTCPDVATFQCLVDGQGTGGGATAAVNVLSGSSWESRDLPVAAGIQKIESAVCTAAACVGVGFGAAGAAAVVDNPNHVGSWNASSPPSTLHVSIIRQVECPAANDCLALGTTTSGPVILGAVISTTTGALSLKWAADGTPPGMALTATSHLTCAGGSACFVVGTTSSGPVVLVGGATGAQQPWGQETLTPSVSSIADLTCASTTACLLDGTSSAGGPAVLVGGVSTAPETWKAETLPTLPSGTTLSALTCVGSTACLAIGNSTTGGPSVVIGAASPTPGAWTSQTLKSAPMTSPSLLACGGKFCAVVGTASPDNAVIATGPAATGSHAWSLAKTVPSGLSLTHLHCTATTTCVAIGASKATEVAVLLTGELNATGAKFGQATFPTVALASDVRGARPSRPIRLAAAVRHPRRPTSRPLSTTEPRPAPAIGVAATYRRRITSVAPSSGPTTGGTTITLQVANFTLKGGPRATVIIGGLQATTVRITPTHSLITAKTPAHRAGTVTVTLFVEKYFYFFQTATKYTAFTYTTKPAPTITSVAPATGLTTGGTAVTITGTHLTGATSVTFGGSSARTVTVVSPTKITAVTPTHAPGKVTVAVTTPGGTASDATAFTYVYPQPTITKVTPATGATTGGTSVTITGTHFIGVTSVTFGGSAARTVKVVSTTEITAITPTHAAGKVAVTVTSSGGTYTDATAFTFVVPKPVVTAVTPPTGTTAGGTVVSISGHFLTSPTSVTFGGSPATHITVVSPTRINVTTPAHTVGVVSVTVVTSSGTATKSTAFKYVRPRPTAPVFLSGVSCYMASALTCVAAGATEHGAVLLVGTKGATGFTWTASAPVTSTHSTRVVQGLVEPTLPISARNTALASSYVRACTARGTALCTTIGPLFPYSSGYTVGAGNCLPELATSTAVETIPATTSTTFGPPAVVPLGLLAVKVLRNGSPVAGATVTITVHDSTAACNTTTVTLGTTETDGSLAVASIIETYTIKVTSGSTSKTVTANVLPDSVTDATGSSALLPSPLQVTLP